MIFRETPTKEPTGKNTSEAVMLSDFNGRILARGAGHVKKCFLVLKRKL